MSKVKSHGMPALSAGRILRGLGLVLLLSIAMAIAAAAGGYLMLKATSRRQEVIVPDLTKMTQSEADTELARVDLLVQVAGERSEPRVGRGRVITQEPPPGSRTRPQRAVRVYLSTGIESLEVPQMAGMPLHKARLLLEQMGLRVGDVARAASNDQPADSILAQRPAAGYHRQRGDVIDLLVSRGAPHRRFVMPRLEGLDVDRATNLMSDVGVRVGVNWSASSLQPAGRVLEQRPAEGHPLQENQTVQLVVAK